MSLNITLLFSFKFKNTCMANQNEIKKINVIDEDKEFYLKGRNDFLLLYNIVHNCPFNRYISQIIADYCCTSGLGLFKDNTLYFHPYILFEYTGIRIQQKTKCKHCHLAGFDKFAHQAYGYPFSNYVKNFQICNKCGVRVDEKSANHSEFTTLVFPTCLMTMLDKELYNAAKHYLLGDIPKYEEEMNKIRYIFSKIFNKVNWEYTFYTLCDACLDEVGFTKYEHDSKENANKKHLALINLKSLDIDFFTPSFENFLIIFCPFRMETADNKSYGILYDPYKYLHLSYDGFGPRTRCEYKDNKDMNNMKDNVEVRVETKDKVEVKDKIETKDKVETKDKFVTNDKVEVNKGSDISIDISNITLYEVPTKYFQLALAHTGTLDICRSCKKPKYGCMVCQARTYDRSLSSDNKVLVCNPNETSGISDGLVGCYRYFYTKDHGKWKKRSNWRYENEFCYEHSHIH